jgi:hypothetical protein
MYVSVDGKIIASASPLSNGNERIRYSTDYGVTFADGSTYWNWQTICGTSQGSRLFAISDSGVNVTPTLWQSTDQGVNWAQITSPGLPSDAYIHRMRCSGDGTYLTATDFNTSFNGRYYTSSNSGSTWTARTLSATAGYTISLCFSRSGAIQYITWRNNVNTSSAIYRSFDYGVTFTLVQGHIADGGYWRRIECDATGRFVYATRYSSITANYFIYFSNDYGATWNSNSGINGCEDVWVSATGQFVAAISNPQGGGISYAVISADYGRSYTGVNMGASTTYTIINGSGDGSVLVLGSLSITQSGFPGTGFIRVARQGQQNIQDLSVVGGTISKVGGVYTLTNDVVLWYSGITNQTTDVNSIFFDDFSSARGKIDLNQFDLRYEMDINWNYTPTVYPHVFINLGLNSVEPTSIANFTVNGAQTILNMAEQPSFNTSSISPKMYTSRFFCGYSAGQGTGTTYRYRTTLSGHISLTTRTNAQISGSFSSDIALGSRLITNDFVCNTCLLEQVNTNQLRIFSGDNNIEAGQNLIRGCAVWETTCDNAWSLGSSGGTDLNAGVFRLFLRFTDVANANRSRGAEVKYSIYRVRK